MGQVATEMAELAQGIPNLRKELKNIQITLMMQDEKLDEIQQQIDKLPKEAKEEMRYQNARGE